MLSKEELVRKLDSVSNGVRPLKVSQPEYDQGLEYGLLLKLNDGNLYLADCYNPVTINPRMILVSSLPEDRILSMCQDAVTAKFKSLSDDYAGCCEKGDHIEWASDAYETINEFLGIPHKVQTK